MVAPIQGVPNTLSRQLASLIVEGLDQQGVPATTRSTPGAVFMLEGNAGRDSIVWQLRSPDGFVAGRFSERVSLSAHGGRYPDAALPEYSEIAVLVADRVGPLISEYEANPPALGTATETVDKIPLDAAGEMASPKYPNLAVLSVDGAPSDGGTELPRAMRNVLRKEGVPVFTEPDDDTYLLLGDVQVAESPGGLQAIEITWMLLLPDGQTLGSIRQTNEVPHGSLSIGWGEVATAVAQGAAEGVISLLSAVSSAPSGE